MPDDQFRISEFKKVLRQNADKGVIDLDKSYHYSHKFPLFPASPRFFPLNFCLGVHQSPITNAPLRLGAANVTPGKMLRLDVTPRRCIDP